MRKANICFVGILAVIAIRSIGNGVPSGNGANASSRSPLGAVYSEAVAGGDPGVHIHWSLGALNPRNVISFNVYRDNYQPNTGNGSGGTTTSTSSTTSTSTTTSTSGTIGGSDVGPVLTVGPGTFDAVDDGYSRTFTYNYANLSGAGSSTVGTLSNASQTVSGVQFGVPHQYYVTAVYAVTNPVTGVTGVEKSPPNSGAPTGSATPLYPTSVTGASVLVNNVPANNALNVNLTSVVFQFASIPGADSYVVDVSPDATFFEKGRVDAGAVTHNSGRPDRNHDGIRLNQRVSRRNPVFVSYWRAK